MLTSCNADLESVPVEVLRDEGSAQLAVRDTLRRPPEEELLLTPETVDEYAITIETEISAPVIDTVQLRLEGEVATDSSVILSIDDRSEVEYRFSDLYRSEGGTVPKDGTYLFTLPEWFLKDGNVRDPTTITFLRGEGSYRVRSIAFLRRDTPRSVVLDKDKARFDDRVSLWEDETSLRLKGFDSTIAIEYTQDPDAFTKRERPPTVTIGIGGQTIRYIPHPGQRTVTIRPELWGSPGGEIVIRRVSPGFQPTAIYEVTDPIDPLEPIPIELSELLVYPTERWRHDEYEIFAWSAYPNILWIDSVDYRVQSAFFKRLAFFVEKRRFMGTLVTDDELAGRHGYNAHNYRPEGLVAFFNAVEAEGFPINRYEETLRDLIESRGIIYRDETGSWAPGVGGVLGISMESYPALRRLLLVHEAMHGVFYEVPAFREGVIAYWYDSLTERERQYFRDAFAWMGYSPTDEYLMYNEFQAYVLQQSESAVPWYFRTRVADRVRGSVGRSEPVDQFLADHLDTFRRAGSVLNALLFQTAGMVGGDPFSLAPVDGERAGQADG